MVIWKKIKEYPDYSVSNTGLIKSHKFGKERILKSSLARGYEQNIIRANKKSITVKIHRLVANHFLEIITGKNFVNHKDGNKKNNNVKNLEWCTPKENGSHASKNGLMGIGSKKLTLNEVIEIRKLLLEGLSYSKIGKKYNVHRMTIYSINKGRNWKNEKNN
jgi:hypothetical protein